MNILVTGATGFVGRHVVSQLGARQEHRIIATGRDEAALQTLGCDYVVHDLESPQANVWDFLGRPDLLIHLAWDGLDDYRCLSHLEHTLTAHMRFLRRLWDAGTPRLVCAGTCLEYGRLSGCLTETERPQPTLPYAIAKDVLRRYLECLTSGHPGSLLWLRLFYLHGKGQKANSLLPQLERAVEQGAETFAMTSGEQLRDYLPVERAARQICELALKVELEGIVNVCSGTPTSVRRVAEERLEELGATLRLDLGKYPQPEHEPLAYWGCDRRLKRAVATSESCKSLARMQAAMPASRSTP